MRRSTVMRRLRKLALALTACLCFAVVAPLYFSAERRHDDSFTISAVNAAPSYRQELAFPVRLSAAPDLTLSKAVIDFYGLGGSGGTMSHVRLDRPVFTLNTARRHTTSAAAAEAESVIVPQVIQQIAALGFDLITIQRGTLRVIMRDGGQETIKDIKAVVKKNRDGQITCLCRFTVRDQRLEFEATVHPPPDKARPLRRPLSMTFKSGTSGLLQGSFDGYADLGASLQLSGRTELSTTSLRAIGRWFGIPLYQTEGFNATTVKGELTWAHGSLAFEKAHIAVDGNEGNGRVVLNLGSRRPTLEATLDFDALNLTPYVEAAHVGPLAFAQTKILGFELPAAWSSAFDISLPMIGHLDADLRISTQEVSLKGLAFGRGAATITAQSGKLHADIAELQLPLGTLSAQLTAIMSETAPRYLLRAKIEDLDMGSASGLLLHSPAVSGKGRITLDLTSTGHYLADVAKRLSGKVALTMPEGGRIALDLEAARTLAKGETRGWSELTKAQTDLDWLEVQAWINDGVAFTEDVQARAGDAAMTLTGRLGLVDGNMKMSLMLKAKHPPDRPLRRSDEPDEVLSLHGSWVNPRVRWQEGKALSGEVPRP